MSDLFSGKRWIWFEIYDACPFEFHEPGPGHAMTFSSKPAANERLQSCAMVVILALMNRRKWIQFAVLSAIGAVTCFSKTTAAVPDSSPEQRLIKVGETRKYDNGVKVKFLRVIRDKRCPLEDECEKPGDAVIALRIKVGNYKARVYQLHTNRGRRTIWIPLDAPKLQNSKRKYAIRILTLSPLPLAPGKTTPAEEFRLNLDVALRR